MTNRALVIVGSSLATGLGMTFVPEGLVGFPEQIQTILSSGISVGFLCALVLNLVLPKSEEDRIPAEAQLLESEAPAADQSRIAFQKVSMTTIDLPTTA